MSSHEEFDEFSDMFTDMRAARSPDTKSEKPQEKPVPVPIVKKEAPKPKKPKEIKEKTDVPQPSATTTTLWELNTKMDMLLSLSQTKQASMILPDMFVEDWEMIYRSNKKRFKPNTPLCDILERLNKMIKGVTNNVAP